jgi:hypothetical protein
MKFTYTALGSDTLEKTGKIEASSAEDAKQKLNQMGLSVLTLEESSAGNSSEKTFSFFGIDTDFQEAEGDIEAEDIVSAYKRLVEEYELDVQWIVDNSLPPAVKESRKKKSVQIVEDLALENAISIKKPERKKKTQDTEVEFSEKFLKEQQKVQERVAGVSRALSALLPFFAEVNTQAVSQFEKRKEELEKIKMSNNLQYISETLDALITDASKFVYSHKELALKAQKEVVELETFHSNAMQAKMQKYLINFSQGFSFLLNKFSRKIDTIRDKKEKEIPEHKKALIDLQTENKSLLRLLFFHFFYSLYPSELKEKHKTALLKLWKQYKKNSKKYQELKTIEQKYKEIQEREHQSAFVNNVLQEVKLLTGYILALYLSLFAILELSLLKSLFVSPSFAWKVFHSEFIMSFLFFCFLLFFFSALFPQKIKNFFFLTVFFFGTFFLSLLYYYNM